jgi:hypothetical protein
VTQSSISRWRSNYDTIKANAGGERKRQSVLEHPEMEEVLVYWINERLSRGTIVSEELIKEQARTISDLMSIPAEEQLKFSNGWVERFKNRHQLRSIVFHGEAGSVDVEAVRKERERLGPIVGAYKDKDVFNADESAIFYAMPPDRGLARENRQGTKGNKVRKFSRISSSVSMLTPCTGALEHPILLQHGWQRAFRPADYRPRVEASMLHGQTRQGLRICLPCQPEGLDDGCHLQRLVDGMGQAAVP